MNKRSIQDSRGHASNNMLHGLLSILEFIEAIPAFGCLALIAFVLLAPVLWALAIGAAFVSYHFIRLLGESAAASAALVLLLAVWLFVRLRRKS